ncbi:DUF202 domain-containing protein [Sneathiella sp. CAU 1612]|uniref:DUF202 domain-containing protein n=1 Tax=Sneathiella sedimenti TaxID=2816034 RepID=A0ABS3F913_9PROT|nr:DUF202 domain-containing protein [Sneathiella sedimenti]MBO0334838.1 DUF202 domain-containing protein [Sneathiella sedimenti]
MTGDTREIATERRNVDTFKLAVHRTELANRRTLMAYVKTAIALCASAVALLKFLDSRWLSHIGWVLLALAVVTLLIGFADYRRVRKSINDEKRDGGL